MDFDPAVAAKLGFPKLKHVFVERERRWLCREVPRDQVVEMQAITDLYVTGTRLRLREARRVSDDMLMLRLTRKVDVDTHTRLLTSLYLAPEEFALIGAGLRGAQLKKLRHTLKPYGGVTMAVDEFQGELAGLILAEAEFESDAAMRAFAPPDFVAREVTDDVRYTGGALARSGLPSTR